MTRVQLQSHNIKEGVLRNKTSNIQEFEPRMLEPAGFIISSKLNPNPPSSLTIIIITTNYQSFQYFVSIF